jgi:hypothetical protein
VVAKIELMPALRQPADETVGFPVLADRSEIRKSAGKILRQVLRAFLVAPDDVPLGIRKIRVLDGPTVLFPNVRNDRSLLSHNRRRKRPDAGLHKGAFQPEHRDEQNDGAKANQKKWQDSSFQEALQPLRHPALTLPRRCGSL